MLSRAAELRAANVYQFKISDISLLDWYKPLKKHIGQSLINIFWYADLNVIMLPLRCYVHQSDTTVKPLTGHRDTYLPETLGPGIHVDAI